MTQQLCLGEVDYIDPDDEVAHCELTDPASNLVTYVNLGLEDIQAAGLREGDGFRCMVVRDGIAFIRKM